MMKKKIVSKKTKQSQAMHAFRTIYVIYPNFAKELADLYNVDVTVLDMGNPLSTRAKGIPKVMIEGDPLKVQLALNHMKVIDGGIKERMLVQATISRITSTCGGGKGVHFELPNKKTSYLEFDDLNNQPEITEGKKINMVITNTESWNFLGDYSARLATDEDEKAASSIIYKTATIQNYSHILYTQKVDFVLNYVIGVQVFTKANKNEHNRPTSYDITISGSERNFWIAATTLALIEGKQNKKLKGMETIGTLDSLRFYKGQYHAIVRTIDNKIYKVPMSEEIYNSLEEYSNIIIKIKDITPDSELVFEYVEPWEK